MSEHPEPVVIGAYQSEFEANIVSNMLRNEGVPCEVSGGMLGGMRAEAPGFVEVLVPAEFAERARALIEKHEDRSEPAGDDGAD
tara:strand:- start:177124 stop:177375 length:252 start_codon:yes stop_codon:yes gene_type:complete